MRTCFRRCWFILVCLATAPFAWAQHPELQVPEGTRHFVVLVDSSGSMVARSAPPAPPWTKRRALAKAENELTSILYSPGAVVQGPWFRQGKDLISVVHYGIDTQPRADLAYLRLNVARLDDDYVRNVVPASHNLGRNQFLAAIHPKVRTHLNVLAWAVPMGLTAAATPKAQVQETYVILLNDAQMNDGSMVLEKHTLGMHLNPAARQRLASCEALVDKSVRLTGKGGISSPWFERSYGEGTDLVQITGFKALPTTTPATLAQLDPSVISQAIASSIVKLSASNPILGIQDYQVVYSRSAELQSAQRARSLLAWLLAMLVLALSFAWIYYHLTLARHFQLWLPGYVTSFELPALSQRITSRHIVRVPVVTGEAAAVLSLPSRFIRAVFYRHATLKWDQKLLLANGPAEADGAKLTELPRNATFLWQDRPSTAGEFELAIERPAKNGRNQRARINVRFLSLPRRESSSLEKL